jgi:zinc and cadmium transporter
MNDSPVALYTLLSVISISLVSLVGLFVISMRKAGGRRFFTLLISFSAGALLGDVFIHLLPELAEDGGLTLKISLYILGSIVGFFMLEKYLLWHHHHGEGDEHEHDTHPFVYNILIGDFIHNFIDGLIIAGAYQLDIRLGIATTVAVVLHEIPQEIGDFAVLVYGGFSKSKALVYNLISAVGAVLGALVAFWFTGSADFLPVLVALGAGSFIYISLADLIPQIHKENERAYLQLFGFGLGIAAMALLLLLE